MNVGEWLILIPVIASAIVSVIAALKAKSASAKVDTHTHPEGPPQ